MMGGEGGGGGAAGQINTSCGTDGSNERQKLNGGGVGGGAASSARSVGVAHSSLVFSSREPSFLFSLFVDTHLRNVLSFMFRKYISGFLERQEKMSSTREQ